MERKKEEEGARKRETGVERKRRRRKKDTRVEAKRKRDAFVFDEQKEE